MCLVDPQLVELLGPHRCVAMPSPQLLVVNPSVPESWTKPIEGVNMGLLKGVSLDFYAESSEHLSSGSSRARL